MKATIKDVAREAKVSISTVSYAVNGSDRISNETRQRVLDVARQLNYVPNGNARQLKQKGTRAIGLFLNSWFGPVYSEITRGIEQAVHQHGYDLISCSLYGKENSTASKYLRNRMVDGAIILASSFSSEFLAGVASEHLPLVVLDREVHAPHVYSRLMDNFGGAFNATRHLVSLGCKEVYFFSGPEKAYDNQQRLEGYIAALGFCKAEVNPDYIVQCNFTEVMAYEKMKGLLTEGIRPAAIFAANDEMALGIMKAAREFGVSIPSELKLIGFDNIRESSIVSPELTTVEASSKFDMGFQAAETLFSALGQESAPEPLKIQPTQMIMRETA